MSASSSPNAAQHVVGLVIAGGRSVRFGGEKAMAELAGRPLLIWATARLQASCAAVAVNARPGTETAALARTAGLQVLHDEPGDALGPLAGVKVGLMWADQLGAGSLAVSPCDAPLLPDDLFVRLIEAAGGGAAMAQTAEGRQPLCAIWPVSALATVKEALAEGRHPATWMVLERVGAKPVLFTRAEAFANVNTRAELTVVAERLQAEGAQSSRHSVR